MWQTRYGYPPFFPEEKAGGKSHRGKGWGRVGGGGVGLGKVEYKKIIFFHIYSILLYLTPSPTHLGWEGWGGGGGGGR